MPHAGHAQPGPRASGASLSKRGKASATPEGSRARLPAAGSRQQPPPVHTGWALGRLRDPARSFFPGPGSCRHVEARHWSVHGSLRHPCRSPRLGGQLTWPYIGRVVSGSSETIKSN
jgi:hypothetical protein